jgi:ABC-type sugar transport system ATPase subunit
MAAIRCAGLSKSFGPVHALRPIDLAVADGQFFTLLGPSGCGKTTLLRLIAGLESPTAGEISIDERRVTALPPKDRNLAMVFQDYALYSHMTVRENLAFPLEAQKRPAAEIRDRVEEVARRLQLAALLDRRPRQLSGGQQQRVALGRAIVRSPGVFLMDEPLSNLDAKLRIQMRGELKRLQKDLGITTIYVTHDQEEAMTMSDRIAILRDGVVQQCASPEEIYRRPVNRWVAAFMGNPPMNMLQVTVRDSPAGRLLVPDDSPDAAFPCPPTVLPAKVVVGIRPEHLVIHAGPVAQALEGRVHVVEPVGDHSIIAVRTAAGVMSVKTVSDDLPPMEARVFLQILPGKLHLFDCEHGTRIES